MTSTNTSLDGLLQRCMDGDRASIEAIYDLEFDKSDIAPIIVLIGKQNHYAMLCLGLMYYHGQAIKKDYVVAFKCFTDAANAGNIDATNSIGDMHYRGLVVPKNIKMAIRYYGQAATKGNTFALRNLGFVYYFNSDFKNYAYAFTYYSIALANGRKTKHIYLMLGKMYSKGRGVAQDHAQALYYFKLAATAGSIRANLHLGMAYHFGNGVEQSGTRAIFYYQLAAAKNIGKASCYLGDIFIALTTDQDYSIPVGCYLKAAANGNMRGIEMAARIYIKGIHVKQDYCLALNFLLRANNIPLIKQVICDIFQNAGQSEAKSYILGDARFAKYVPDNQTIDLT